MKISTYLKGLGLIAVAMVLQACADSSGIPVRYEATLTNLTNDQPISPVAVVLHRPGYAGWSAGVAVSAGLELLAEGGDNSIFLNEAAASNQVVDTASAAGAIAPGSSDSLTLSSFGFAGLQLTLAGMLVNTNDAFSGVTGASLASLAPGQMLTMNLHAYDAGTEANSETAATIPGPAGGGEGFNAVRNDRDTVAIHPGVVTMGDGLATSALSQSHRFDQPVARLTVTRLN